MDIAIKPVDLPNLGAPIADTHAHLVMLDDPAGALERAAIAGVAHVETLVDATEAPDGTFGFLQGWIDEAATRLVHWAVPMVPPEVRIVLGTHPHNAKDYTADIERLTEELAGDERVAALGEIGLDYHYDHSPREDQRRAFRDQITLAHRLGLPVVVHLREAHDDGYAILAEAGVPEAGCVLHCFTEGPETAERFLALGCHISFAGPTTFPRAQDIREAVRHVPLDRLLVETDCPFLAPAPYRGRTNEPAWVTLTAAKVAEVKEIDTAVLANAVVANACRLFGRNA